MGGKVISFFVRVNHYSHFYIKMSVLQIKTIALDVLLGGLEQRHNVITVRVGGVSQCLFLPVIVSTRIR